MNFMRISVTCVQEQLVRMGKKNRYHLIKQKANNNDREKLLAVVSDCSAGEEE